MCLFMLEVLVERRIARRRRGGGGEGSQSVMATGEGGESRAEPEQRSGRTSDNKAKGRGGCVPSAG